ncbi:MAG: bifunctional [glutamate--ammonia ligase]-adenylyl-L-tyrosine phosphorylase/[glutamate--ammonia-ligase] adenylyltransferase [Candidatus Binatus sp.]|uniref:bifunctional [glutamate--ammonia ligase]-adenylyl-L-tyrosine phosphorylase/[glutamate--ammonia-ligase] adenylyltransferase n=1 Tax=Candidatus Binatus sp. TaxID=2811406 RepID=UPI0027233B15|nr:bifunctional [glutamate--ammonia ligase]-adenylyl-L-tyrosine phosphorylase/[glutamate--ammonia-ligase] adenylyltransferase [Candidatus Binatus sp.]MDO8430871.1 bifunctional [glutamate--ammonia ligase]-adenylyl-L-tyrosine phosphorylase/[glutamate--ammonia-ligase] adenylyltransferase [Candidatus Binatus sp.]
MLADRLKRRLGNQRLAEQALRTIAARAPDERLAMAFLLKLAEDSSGALKNVLRDRAAASDLIFCLGSSELVATELTYAGAEWAAAFEAARTASASSLIESMRSDPIDAPDRLSASVALAQFNRRMFVRVAIADLLDRIDVADTWRAMSALADECIRAGLELAIRFMGERAKEIGRFCVLAMGKLGARELNLSSDIDLIYLHEPSGSRDSVEAAARLAESLTEMLSPGCFRIDMRLRPGGRNSPLVTPVDGAIGYYQNLGQTWERAALLRARPVAGAIEIGNQLIAELGPFVYRRYLDFDTLRQLRAMKHQIEAELRSPELVEKNIKLGFGGIRELEFIVQSLTLIYGGRDPRLRIEQTIEALEKLDELGYLPSQRANDLAGAYAFLRDVEHKLQVVAGLQTHVLPSQESGMRALAARMGFGKDAQALKEFRARIGAHRTLVASQFRETLAGGEDESAQRPSAAAQSAWNAAQEPAMSAEDLHELGFARAEESSRHLELLSRGPSHALTSPRRRELLERLGPLLLDEMGKLPDPDLALMNLAAFIAAIGARTSFLALLEQHPATRRILLRLFASSAYLSTIFIRHPDMIDTLVRSDLVKARREAAELRDEVRGLVAANADFEGKLDALRAVRHQEFLRIAIADLAGELDTFEVERELTTLAEVVLEEAMSIARGDIASRFKIPATLRLCVIALGRLGAREMSYNSDLDLIFVYGDRAEIAADSREIASRMMQKLIAILESRTREGYAYKLDLRLRPSGNAGPLVTSLEGFREYHRQSSAVWERQALVRARVVAGDRELGKQVEEARAEFVYGRSLSAAEVGEIAAMRTRMQNEIGVEDKTRINIKQGRGGLVDVEFLAQMMALRHGHRHPELRVRNTMGLLAALDKMHLIEPKDARAIEDDYRFLSRLENRLRIESDQPAWALPTSLAALRPLARRMGFEGADAPEQLIKALAERRDRIRAIYERCFTREQQVPA